MGFKTTVAILNWNGQAHLQRFLPSVCAHTPDARILIVDNGSTDGSPAWVRQAFPAVDILELGGNYGFTGGYNRALAQLDTPYVVLLNSDVEVSAGWLPSLERILDADPAMAACQPRIRSFLNPTEFEYAGASGGFLDTLAYPFCRGRILETCETDHNQYADFRPVFWASGACMMVRRELFLEVGGFEESFFAHMEEIDLCWRFWHRGYQVSVEPASLVFHLGAGTLAKESPRKTFLNFRNGLAMLIKNETGSGLLWKMPLRLILDGVAGLRFLAQGNVEACLAIAKAHFSIYGRLGYWLACRKQNARLKTSEVPKSVRFPGLLVRAYFVSGKKTFSDIAWE